MAALPTAHETRTVPRSPGVPAPGTAVYARITRRKLIVVVALLAALCLSLLIDVGWGPARLNPLEVMRAIVDQNGVSATHRVIVWDLRLPMALLAVLVGAALGIAGAEMQTILNNPLASPYTLGISAAASFGAAIGIVLDVNIIPGASQFTVTLNAFIFAMLASLLIYALSNLRGVTTETMVLLGICLVFVFEALNGMLQYIASEEALQQVVFWTMGSLQRASWPKLGIVLIVLVLVFPYFMRNAWKLTALRMGDERARALGVNVGRLRLNTLILISLAAAVAVSFVGTIGFVGLVGPHVARLLVGEDQRYFLPSAALAGALLLSLASIASKTVVPGAIVPIGIITSLVGVPFFLSLILARRKAVW